MSEINMLAVIDTNYVKKALAGNYSKDPAHPKETHFSGDFCYILVNGEAVNKGQGNEYVDFNAKPGDIVKLRGTSIYGNSEDAVIIYNVVRGVSETTNVFNRFVPNVITRSKAAVPDMTKSNGLPALYKPVNFTSFDAEVRTAGTEYFLIYFAIYQLASDGQNQELVTYIQLDPTIRVA